MPPVSTKRLFMAACPPNPLAAEIDESQPSQPNIVILSLLAHQQLLDEVFMQCIVTFSGEQLGQNIRRRS
jgi:hypothetical protein